jgi:hypothetical protein
MELKCPFGHSVCQLYLSTGTAELDVSVRKARVVWELGLAINWARRDHRRRF